MTGVPVAIDSIATSPNGSGQPPSITVARAPAYRGSRSVGPDLAQEVDLVRLDRRLDDLLEVAPLGRPRRPSPRPAAGRPVRRLSSRASRMPFSAVTRPTNAR